ncbi:hypothetical protein AMECASPLE_015730 [Ameca splendens]|uniref:Uncharacterized protein n=1 Tax=Ameca splendens TaxID=208324 RepID=A0ABV0ZLT0_9TELE
MLENQSSLSGWDTTDRMKIKLLAPKFALSSCERVHPPDLPNNLHSLKLAPLYQPHTHHISSQQSLTPPPPWHQQTNNTNNNEATNRGHTSGPSKQQDFNNRLEHSSKTINDERMRRQRNDPGEMDGGSGAVRLKRSRVKGSWGSTSLSDFFLSLYCLSVRVSSCMLS